MQKGVMRPGHVQIRVLDMEAAVSHYRDRLGLIHTHTDSQGRNYFKGWTEVDAFSVVLREADELEAACGAPSRMAAMSCAVERPGSAASCCRRSSRLAPSHSS